MPPTPLEVRPERDLSNRFASLDPNDDGTPTLGSIHRINLDQCPTFKLPKNPPKLNWCYMHLSLMFSELEKERALRAQTEPPEVCGSTLLHQFTTLDTLVHVKQTLYLLLRAAAGVDRDDQDLDRVFALFDTSRGVAYLYIIVARTCLDVGSHTVVADAFVALNTPAVRTELAIALRDTSTSTGDGHGRGPQNPVTPVMRYIGTNADETAAWFHLLPRLTKRCQTWPHKATCAYRTSKQCQQRPGEHALGTWGKQSPLCTCGAGIGTEILPKQFERVAPNLTRAAFSPLFPVPYLKEVDIPVCGSVTGMGTIRENVMFWPPLHDRNVGVGRTDGVGVGYRCRSCGKDGGLTCSRCKRARYCSKECQRADWKVHKKDCQGAPAKSVHDSELA